MRVGKAGFARLWEAGNWETNDSFVYHLSQGIVTLMWVIQHCITLYNTSQSKKRGDARANKKSRDWEQNEREANSLGPPSPPPPPQKIAKVQSQVCSASAS